MSNKPISVNAVFDTQGKITPRYVQIEDDEHMLNTYKIIDYEYDRMEKYAGTITWLFCCYIAINDCQRMIKIKYHINTHQWVLVNPGEG